MNEHDAHVRRIGIHAPSVPFQPRLCNSVGDRRGSKSVALNRCLEPLRKKCHNRAEAAGALEQTSVKNYRPEDDMKSRREQMVARDIAGRGVTDHRVLEAMRFVPRERFIPARYAQRAYDDSPVPIGRGQTISQPYIVALMTELCELDAESSVLEIGTGCGYQTAILSLIAGRVVTIERIAALSHSARRVLESIGVKNTTFAVGDGYEGCPDDAPYDAIVLTAAPPTIPRPLLSQLAADGVLVAPVGTNEQRLVTVRRSFGRFETRFVCHVSFVPMVPGTDDQDRRTPDHDATD